LNFYRKLDKYILNKREKENEKSNFIITFIINAEEKTSKVILLIRIYIVLVLNVRFENNAKKSDFQG